MYKVKILGAGSIGNHLAHAARRLGWRVTLCDLDNAAHPWLAGPQDSYLGFWRRGGGASGEHSHAIYKVYEFMSKGSYYALSGK